MFWLEGLKMWKKMLGALMLVIAAVGILWSNPALMTALWPVAIALGVTVYLIIALSLLFAR